MNEAMKFDRVETYRKGLLPVSHMTIWFLYFSYSV